MSAKEATDAVGNDANADRRGPVQRRCRSPAAHLDAPLVVIMGHQKCGSKRRANQRDVP
jgi:carbonic anhydrase